MDDLKKNCNIAKWCRSIFCFSKNRETLIFSLKFYSTISCIMWCCFTCNKIAHWKVTTNRCFNIRWILGDGLSSYCAINIKKTVFSNMVEILPASKRFILSRIYLWKSLFCLTFAFRVWLWVYFWLF